MTTDANLMNLGDNDEGDKENPVDKSKTPADGDQTPPGDKKDDTEKSSRPDNVPEKFWDKEKNAINTDALLGSYTSLETEHGKLKGTLQAPKEYKVNIPKEYEGKVEIPDDDPMFSGYKEFAKENKMTQAEFDRNLHFWLKHTEAQFAVDKDAEIEKLGGMDKAVARVKTLKSWAKNNLSEKGQEHLAQMGVNAENIEFFEELMRGNSVQDNPPDAEDGLSDNAGELTEAQLRDLMKKEEYWNPLKRDNELVKKVTDGFQKLYSKEEG